MSFISGKPASVTKISFLIITVKVRIEVISSRFVDKFTAKHHASAFTCEHRVAAFVLWTIRLVVPEMVRKTEARQKRAANLQRHSAAGEHHLSLHDSNLRMTDQILTQHPNKFAVGDHVVVHHQYEVALG